MAKKAIIDVKNPRYIIDISKLLFNIGLTNVSKIFWFIKPCIMATDKKNNAPIQIIANVISTGVKYMEYLRERILLIDPEIVDIKRQIIPNSALDPSMSLAKITVTITPNTEMPIHIFCIFVGISFKMITPKITR